jgi:cephalosporin-C deacetylase
MDLIKKIMASIILCCFILCVQAQDLPLNIRLEVNDEDGVIINKNTIQAYLTVKNSDIQEVQFSAEWTILTDDWQPLKVVTLSETVEAGRSLRMDYPLFRFPAPGFYRIRVIVKQIGFDPQNLEHVIGVDPEKITALKDGLQDLEEFWTREIAGLAEIPPNYKLTPIKRESSKTNLFEVEMKSYNGLTVRGWLEVPKKKGVYPALLRVPGYQENIEPIDAADDLIVFSFNTRDHGESDDSDGKATRSWDMWVRGLESIDNYYYKGLFLDCIRAMDFLETRKDVDQDRIAVWGGSQGGGLSFATAALDDRVDLCIADIPFMCEFPKYFEITHWKEVDTWFSEHPKENWESILNTLAYYDTKNLAHKIKCPVWMGIGLQDDVCPPATSFVTYNYIESEKSYVVYKNDYHSQPDEHYENRMKELRAYLKNKK